MEIRVDSILEGTVKSITKFGAFVSLPGGRSGLVHISEIAHSYVNNVSDHLQEGQQVNVKVVGIDEVGRINLSIKKTQDPPPPLPMNQNARRPAPGGAPRQQQTERKGFEPKNAAPRPPARNMQAPTPPANAAQPGTGDFENMMKQFMQNSDSKLSSLRLHEKRSSRRSGHR